MVGLILMDLKKPLSCPPSTLMPFWGRTFLFSMVEKGERKRATISVHVHTLDQAQVSREDKLRANLKIDGEQLDDLNSWSIWKTILTLRNINMDSTNSSLSRITEAHMLEVPKSLF